MAIIARGGSSDAASTDGLSRVLKGRRGAVVERFVDVQRKSRSGMMIQKLRSTLWKIRFDYQADRAAVSMCPGPETEPNTSTHTRMPEARL